jgi:GNAT superfamily N-acetyltransferase
MRIGEADRNQIEAILGQSYAVWSDGLNLADYVAFNLAQMESAWGRERYRFLAGWNEAGELLSSLKLFSLPASLDGRPVRVAGIGAVFTPADRRGKGHAAALVEGALVRARESGCELALLMSEIGGDFYARLGFTALPAQEAACLAFLPVPWPKEPGWVADGDPFSQVEGLRPYVEVDRDAVIALREAAAAGQRFHLRRDRPAWDQALFKATLGQGLRSDGPLRIWVVERGGTVRAYVILKEARAGLSWREHGAAAGDESCLIDLFWSSLAHARRCNLGRIDAWQLPDAIAERRLYPVARRPLRDPVIMTRALDPSRPVPAFTAPEECRISWLDQF